MACQESWQILPGGYPVIGVTENGKGAMVFTLTGPDYFPSAAYIPIDTSGTASGIRLAGALTGVRSFESVPLP